MIHVNATDPTKKIGSKTDDIELVYYDTNVWVAWAIGTRDKYFLSAKKLIKELVPNKKVAVVPDLVIIETIYALRKKLIQKSKYIGKSKNHIQKVQSDVGSDICANFLDLIESLAQDKKIHRVIPDKTIADHHSVVLKKIKNYREGIKIVNGCPDCNKQVPGDFKGTCPHCGSATISTIYKYKGLGGEDLEHAYFAQIFNVRTFYTFDKGFLDLREDPDFKFEIIVD